jgi:hypothetical protein
MSTLRQLRNLWIPWITAIVLACFSNAVAQAGYRVTDLGTQGNDNLGCAMSLNNQGWTEIMAGSLVAGQQNNIFGKLLNGRALTQRAGCGQDPRLSGNPCKAKHRQVGCRGRTCAPKVQFAREC